MKREFSIPINRFIAIIIISIIIASCEKEEIRDDPFSQNYQQSTVELITGDNQTAEVGMALANRVEVLVKDENGNPLSNVMVKFEVGEGAVNFAIDSDASIVSVNSNSEGKASVKWILGYSIGPQALIVTTSTSPYLQITATATESTQPEAVIEVLSGDNQNGMVDMILPSLIEIQVKDRFGNPYVGAGINFNITEGYTNPAGTTSDNNGYASTRWSLGPTVGTQYLNISVYNSDGSTLINSITLTANATANASLNIGDFYAGGVIFWLDGVGGGLVCSINDQSTGVDWGCNGTSITGALGTSIGSGLNNTSNIISICQTAGIAAELCSSLLLNGFDDWFLPSIDELNEMYLHNPIIGTTSVSNGGTSFANAQYWSSTESTGATALSENLLDGVQTAPAKDLLQYVRAIRAF